MNEQKETGLNGQDSGRQGNRHEFSANQSFLYCQYEKKLHENILRRENKKAKKRHNSVVLILIALTIIAIFFIGGNFLVGYFF